MAIDAAVCVASGCCRGRLMMNLCPTRSKGLGGVRTSRLDGVIVSARRTHLRNVSGVHPSSCATEMIVDHCEERSPSCSNTTRTACSRTSGQYLVLLFTTPSFLWNSEGTALLFLFPSGLRDAWIVAALKRRSFWEIRGGSRFLATPYGRGADSTHASDLASLFDNVINSSLARATGAPESRPDCLGTQMCRQWLRWRHVLAQDSQELEGHDGAEKI